MDGNFIGLVAVAAPFLMVITIVWLSQRNKLEEKRIEATADASAHKAAEYTLQIQKLEDRVQVLERIVTDRGYDVATQIEALRDTREVEQADSGVPLNISKKEQA